MMFLGKVLSNAEHDSLRIKYNGIVFDGITKFYPLPDNLVLPYEHNHVSFEFAAVEPAKPYLVNYQYFLEGYDKEWSPLTKKTSVSFGNIDEGNYTFKLKAQSPEGIWSEPVIYKFKVLPPWYRTWWMYLTYTLLMFTSLYSIYKWRVAAIVNEKNILEDKVTERTREVVEQKNLAEKQKGIADSQRIIAEEQRNITQAQKHIIEEKQKEILDSIHYASRIQQALLKGEEYIRENFKADHFILFKPKDIVAGDFYWALKHHNLFYIATADCTGHGVPGAFMSMLNISFLNENVIERGIKMPDEILNAQRTEIIKALNPRGSENSKDGMDCVLCAYDLENNKLHFAAAYNPLCIVRNGELLEYKANKMSVGKHERDNELFNMHTIDLKKGDVVYAYTDGYLDQFGITGKKVKSKTLKEMFVKISQMDLGNQKEFLDNFIEEWKSGQEQTDDILVIGVRI